MRPMRILPTILATIIMTTFLTKTSIAQTSCEEIKKENEYLRKALKITSAQNIVTSSNIEFNLIKCIGNKKEQTVELVLTLINHDANQEFQFQQANALDIEANEYKTYQFKIGSANTRNQIYTDTPVKTIIRFNKVLPGTKILRTVGISYFYGEPGHTKQFEYKNVSIDWR
jgi:hypothetical protein